MPFRLQQDLPSEANVASHGTSVARGQLERSSPTFTDTEGYRAYDQDSHNDARAGLLPLTEQIARVQFEIP